ncbi:hypothetical protein KJ684_01280 [Patescibacteria group bacterium]|nr:hypothetical protein [Patescibacteria group bacterium]
MKEKLRIQLKGFTVELFGVKIAKGANKGRDLFQPCGMIPPYEVINGTQWKNSIDILGSPSEKVIVFEIIKDRKTEELKKRKIRPFAENGGMARFSSWNTLFVEFEKEEPHFISNHQYEDGSVFFQAGRVIGKFYVYEEISLQKNETPSKAFQELDKLKTSEKSEKEKTTTTTAKSSRSKDNGKGNKAHLVALRGASSSDIADDIAEMNT